MPKIFEDVSADGFRFKIFGTDETGYVVWIAGGGYVENWVVENGVKLDLLELADKLKFDGVQSVLGRVGGRTGAVAVTVAKKTLMLKRIATTKEVVSRAAEELAPARVPAPAPPPAPHRVSPLPSLKFGLTTNERRLLRELGLYILEELGIPPERYRVKLERAIALAEIRYKNEPDAFDLARTDLLEWLKKVYLGEM